MKKTIGEWALFVLVRIAGGMLGGFVGSILVWLIALFINYMLGY